MEDHNYSHPKHRQKLVSDEVDRLSTLPDPILTEILSLIPINTAVSTSILCRRWPNLWTGVTSFEFHYPNRKITTSTARILSQLTSPKIDKFVLTCDKNGWETYRRDLSYEIASFPIVCNRKVEQIKVISHKLFVPACVFQCPTLVKLELDVTIECKFAIVPKIGLPNLKKLSLFCGQLNSLRPIANLFRSCPLLEDLSLTVNVLGDRNSIEIIAPNLKLLNIKLMVTSEWNEIVIDAPMLADLKIRDSSNVFRFSKYPSQLVSACIEFAHELIPWDGNGMNVTICLDKAAEFVQGLSNVSSLQLKRNMKLFTYLDSEVDVAMPVFHNLSCFKTTLNKNLDVDDFLLSLQCAPNLEDLELTVEYSPILNFSSWCAPGCCSLSRLKTVKIWGLLGYDDELSLLEFLLKNAISLVELQLMVCIYFGAIDRDDKVRKERKFCEAFFKLPRSSPTSKLVFSGEHINETSEAIE